MGKEDSFNYLIHSNSFLKLDLGNIFLSKIIKQPGSLGQIGWLSLMLPVGVTESRWFMQDRPYQCQVNSTKPFYYQMFLVANHHPSSAFQKHNSGILVGNHVNLFNLRGNGKIHALFKILRNLEHLLAIEKDEKMRDEQS
ncbi:hypothetical protein EGR_04291 [Echinococcus granulosus]|uniref:Uncharacterized protein n=1 Tax=Echinococcus granulosus TaxID=6210 RepID=W6URA3_ECHGR|nr:hypothetical protein EGR_04291 [Echinococcus granulosus]EUB60852.1 hypothetical protein EGR_04291 [Echinococcus granulosus]